MLHPWFPAESTPSEAAAEADAKRLASVHQGVRRVDTLEVLNDAVNSDAAVVAQGARLDAALEYVKTVRDAETALREALSAAKGALAPTLEPLESLRQRFAAEVTMVDPYSNKPSTQGPSPPQTVVGYECVENGFSHPVHPLLKVGDLVPSIDRNSIGSEKGPHLHFIEVLERERAKPIPELSRVRHLIEAIDGASLLSGVEREMDRAAAQLDETFARLLATLDADLRAAKDDVVRDMLRKTRRDAVATPMGS